MFSFFHFSSRSYLKFLLLFLFALFSFSFFLFFFFSSSYAQRGPSFEVCNTPHCYPKVENVHLVQNENGVEPGDHTYKRGSVLRLHAQITDPGGVYSVKAYIKDKETGESKVIIPLYDDGDSLHGDDLATKQNSQNIPPLGSDGAEDNIYSNKWFANYYLETNKEYCLTIRTEDNFGNVYTSEDDNDYNPPGCNPDPGEDALSECDCELVFTLRDFYLSNCQEGELRCNKSKREQCVFNEDEGRSFWALDISCSSGECCGIYQPGNPTSVYCCPYSHPDCAYDNSQCITCDHTCNGTCSNSLCSPTDDPDCKPNGEGGGNPCCGNGVCESGAGEDVCSCADDCLDIAFPEAKIKGNYPTISDNNCYNGVCYNLGTFHNNGEQLELKVILIDASPIAPSPSLTLKLQNNSSITKDFSLSQDTTDPDNNTVDHDCYKKYIYTATLLFNDSWSLGSYDIYLNVQDASSNQFPSNLPLAQITVTCYSDQICLNCFNDSNCAPESFFACDNNDKVKCTNPIGNCWVKTTTPCSSGEKCYSSGFSASCCADECNPNDSQFSQCSSDNTSYQVCKLDPNNNTCYISQTVNCNTNNGEQCVGNNGNPLCCAISSSPQEGGFCASIDEEACDNSGQLLVCQFQGANSCPVWTQDQTCTGQNQHCANSSSNGAYCCTDECSKGETKCGGSNNDMKISCVLSEGCWQWDNNSCNTGSYGGKCYMSGGTAQCCTNECLPTDFIPQCNSDGQISSCQLDNTTGCYEIVYNNCPQEDQTCHLDDNNHAHCCQDICTEGEKQCGTGEDFDKIQICEKDSSTGCTHWVTDTTCPSGDQCYPPNPGNGHNDYYCDSIDTNSPEITLSSPTSQEVSWTETTDDDFNDGTFDQTETNNNSLKLSIKSPGESPQFLINRYDYTGYKHTCVLLNNGNVHCYGYNRYGQSNDYNGGDAIGVATGDYHTCILKSNGNVYCYGKNIDNRADNYKKGDAIGVAAGDSYTCVLRSNGNVRCYGRDLSGETNDYLGGDAIGVAAGYKHTCILRNNGNVHCYGDNHYGQANDYNGGDAIGVATGDYHTCILKSNGNVHCYGYNWANQAEDYLGGDAIGVAAGVFHTCILLNNGNVHCYGANGKGQANDYKGRDAIGVATGDWYTCILKSNGNVHCYGEGGVVDYRGGKAVTFSFLNYYYSSGTYASSIYDTTVNIGFSSISWAESLPSGTSLTLKVRTCDDSQCSAAGAVDESTAKTWSTCEAATNGQGISSLNCVDDGDQYIQYYVELSTTDTSVTPSLDSVTINFIQLPIIQEGDIVALQFSISDPSGVSSVNKPQLYIQHPDGTIIKTLTLYDDGNHGDGLSGDGIFANTWNTAGLQKGGIYYLDVWAEDIRGNSATANNVGKIYVKIPPKTVVWVTSSSYTGNLGGKSGADLKCQNDPNKPANTDNIRAFICINNKNEIRDMSDNDVDGDGVTGPYPYNEPIYWYNASSKTLKILRNNWATFSGTNALVNSQSSGTGITSYVWTGCLSNGSNSSYNCSGFTSSSNTVPSGRGNRGHPYSITSSWLQDSTIGHCDQTYRIRCIGVKK